MQRIHKPTRPLLPSATSSSMAPFTCEKHHWKSFPPPTPARAHTQSMVTPPQLGPFCMPACTPGDPGVCVRWVPGPGGVQLQRCPSRPRRRRQDSSSDPLLPFLHSPFFSTLLFLYSLSILALYLPLPLSLLYPFPFSVSSPLSLASVKLSRSVPAITPLRSCVLSPGLCPCLCPARVSSCAGGVVSRARGRLVWCSHSPSVVLCVLVLRFSGSLSPRRAHRPRFFIPLKMAHAASRHDAVTSLPTMGARAAS